ncbi:MAG: hypothetical protein AAGF67_04055, partial [Verrucomicrobiota bacterium]
IAIIMIMGIASSRLYLGVHDIEDILVGALFGVSLLGALVLKVRCCPRCCRDLFNSMSVLVVPGLLMLYYPEGGKSTGKLVMIVTFFAAWVIGHQIEKRSLKFANPSGWKRLLTGVFGMLLLLIVAFATHRILLTVEFPGDLREAAGGLVIGAITTLLIPLVLVKGKLLQRANS